ncbi:hypothetical protein Taro_006237 [Colocasia esculenta]|uniref:CCHC-type domain-containing protein n=1 Tax=Colocasia esculenta TaxID=4460 RepID=A0A843TX25_COLES|nr:hypothetical protein [Colocasia esculenta]
MAEYVAQFSRLGKYAAHLVAIERMKAKHFLNGLKPQYITQLAPLDIQTYTEMVKKAQLLEDAMDFTDRIKAKFVKKEMTSGQSSAKPNNGKKCPFNITEGSNQERKPKAFVHNTPAKSNYKHCDKPGHIVDECWRKVGVCVRCKSHEHHIPECPLLKENERRPNAPKKQGRLQALYDEEPAMEGGVVEGVVFLLVMASRGEMSLGVRIKAQVPAPQADHGGPSIMERFKRMSPPSFKGESDSLLAESWMREIEKIFWAIRCAEDDKERADVWWSSLLRTRFEDGAVEVGWDEFVRLFRAKFVPKHIQDKMEQEFLSLTQGSMTVLEYEARFAELSKYTPHIVADERRKAKKFMMGLKPSLRTRLVAFDHRTLEQALSVACRQEGEMEQYLEEKKASQKRPAAPFQRQERKKATFQSPQRSVASGSGQVSSQRSPSSKKECPHCGRAHGGTECWLVARKCLKCGSSDHKIKDCPRLQQGAQRGPAPVAAPATGRPWRPRAPARSVSTSADVY